MINIKTHCNTILVSFDKSSKLNRNNTDEFKRQLISKLTSPFSNIIVDFNEVSEINQETIDALIAGQRLSKMNRGQVSLFNVKEQVYKALRLAKVDHLFFFCDQPKPFSQNILLA
ncbi:STAS domain-containing protein [Labilibacter marinus]|uniref:STAS domain-containing protein n=1 Tax=Labilibacter marinus TaxID=1477105 RepID=UPI00094F8DCA|nr:STAS domain-containing protein [Labilibacter marinus]